MVTAHAKLVVLLVSIKMERVVIVICLFAIITQQIQCSPYYDDKQSVEASCISFMNQDNIYILDAIRSTALRLKNEDVELTESMDEVLNDVNEYECLDCKSHGNSSACSCSTSLPTHQDDVSVMTKMMNDRSLWLTTAICDRVANKATNHNNSKIFKNESRFVAIDLISSFIEIIACIVTRNECFRNSISPTPSINPLPSAMGTKGPTFSPVARTIAPTRVPTQFVSATNLACREGLISSDTNNDTYIDADEYLLFVGTQGCEEVTEMTEDLAYAFRKICVWIRLIPPYTKFSISSVYGNTLLDRSSVDLICDETAQAIEKEGCSPRKPRIPIIPWLPPVYVPPFFVPNPTTLAPILPAPVLVPIQPEPNRPVPQKTAAPSFSIDSKKCIEFFFASNADNNTRINESEYLNFVILRTECSSLRSLPQQLAANLLSWCEQDFDAQSCKSRVEFAIEDGTTFEGRLNIICAPIALDCAGLKSNPVLVSPPSPIPVQIPNIINVPTIRPESVPTMLPDIVPEPTKVQSLGPITSNPTRSPTSSPTSRPTLQLQKCIDALAKADSDDDNLLDVTEYTALTVDYFSCPGTSTLSESQLKAFIYLSCKCEKLPNATRVCCLERNARIDIAGVNSPNRSVLEIAELEDVCINSENARDNACSEPVLAPNQSPVVENPANEVPLAGNSLAPVVFPATFGYENCGLLLSNSDSDGDRFLTETEYLQFLRSYGKCNVTALTEQQNKTFFKLVADSGSNNYSIAIADPFVPYATEKEIEFLKSLCYLEDSCLPAIHEESILDCTDKLARADIDNNSELDETEFSGFIVDYKKCPASRVDASDSFSSLTTTLSTTTINIIGARNAEVNRSEKEMANLRLICNLTTAIECQNGAEKCILNMLHADQDEDGMLVEEEYLRFVNKQSRDCDASENPFLSLAHRTTFQIASCLDCIIRAEGDVNCCHPHHARMSIDYFTMPDSKRSSLQKDLVRNICVSTRCASSSINFSTKNERVDLKFPLLLLCTIIVLAMVCIRLHYIDVKS